MPRRAVHRRVGDEPITDRSAAPHSGFSNAVQVSRTQVQIGTPFPLSCRAAVSLALWEQHVLLPEAQRVLADGGASA